MPDMRSLTDYEEIPILKPFVREMPYKPLSAPRLKAAIFLPPVKFFTQNLKFVSDVYYSEIHREFDRLLHVGYLDIKEFKAALGLSRQAGSVESSTK